MPRKRKLTDLGNRCRICLASDACTSQLFVECLRPKLQNLEKCSLIEILDKPNYPKKICYICLYKLEMWSEFKLQFLKTNQTLVNHFKIVDPLTTGADKVAEAEGSVDELFAGIDGKRPRVVIEDIRRSTLEPNVDVPMKSPTVSPTKKSILKTVDPNVEAVIINETDNKIITVNKSHTSDSSSSPVRKITRAKKVERDALTKRWEERKNALLAATGEIPSESESDNGTQLSPVQKARAKLNSSSEKDEQKSKKIHRALKNLETNMTEKYTVSVEDAIAVDERKTRSRRGHSDNQVKEVSPTKPTKTLVIEEPKTDVAQKEPAIPEKQLETKVEKPLPEEVGEKTKEKEQVDKNVDLVAEKSAEAPVLDQPEQSREEDDVEIIDVDDDTSNVDSVPAPEPTDSGEPTFTPQLVTSEVHLGNVTYIVKTTLGLPNTPSTKSDISLKTNGINIDATNQDGGKIDLSNTAQLQTIGTDIDSATKEKNTNGSGSNMEKCLNIEIEGMEADALQRVQLELAKFVKEDVPKRLLDESSANSEPDPKNISFKDTYDSLEYQLKNIVEKVLRKNYEADKKNDPRPSNNNKISPEFAKAAEKSPVFQPEVKMTKFNLGTLCKTYHINNLHILEEDKRQRRVVGPLSKTLGRKRTLKLPKRYDGFDITLPTSSEVVRETTPPPTYVVIKRVAASITEEVAQIDDFDDPMDDDDDRTENGPALEEEPMLQDTPAENSHSLLIDRVSSVQENESGEKEKDMDTKPVVKKQIEKTAAKETLTPTSKTITSLQPVLTMIKNAQPHVETILLVPTSPPTNTQVINTEPKKKSLPSLTTRPSLGNVNNKPTLKQILPSPTKAQSKSATSAPAKTMVKRQRHICGICGRELFSKEEAESHVKSHKTDSIAVNSKPLKPILPKVTGPKPTIVTTTTLSMPTTQEPTSLPQVQAQSKAKPKPKLMRCKRCQAIVEAKEVRSHVCNSVKFNCTLCDCSFGAEHLLLEHIETHARNSKIVKKTEVKSAANKSGQNRTTNNMTEENDSVSAEQEDENQQNYSCFVCDKVFLEEDQMKEHLQMHCEEVANDSDADGHQCAFCGEKFQSEEILEDHVGNHLKEDGDEKINMLINMETRRVNKPKKTTPPLYRCEECSETFTSSYQLALHLRVHDDESMAVDEEPEEDEHYVCNVCDEIFDSPDELAEHLNTEHNGNTQMCILCETTFSSVRELQEHVSTHL